MKDTKNDATTNLIENVEADEEAQVVDNAEENTEANEEAKAEGANVEDDGEEFFGEEDCVFLCEELHLEMPFRSSLINVCEKK